MTTNNDETLLQRYEREEMINKKIESEINPAQTEANGASKMTNTTKQAKPMKSIPLDEIAQILNEVMEIAVSNGADSRSMPDEYVAVAHFVCYPEEYYIPDSK